ncbi:branched-chain amino acid ABC transporter permease [Phreatobacter stygius]|uniref:Branched-chain amino acid ABC transporter permease n=1 Tax=Phreatobacter stygius TaxID=1940610 RepID=A0A4D7AZF1_9HYPH|nr:branched-chain amino acid ABC transporter permease [Phreatobacter stygius]QCI63110.1 branched-chain amino acid ABC transporter permease [Phreatobacter stygius]
MRYVLRTSYRQDTRLFKDGLPQYGWYLAMLACALAAPAFLGIHHVSQLTFVLIFAIAGIGFQIMLGFCGLISLGQAGFLAIGAYACVFLERRGVPFVLALPAAALISAAAGAALGVPVLRLKGLYLAMATMSLGFIIEEAAARWTTVTGGNAGMMVPPISVFGYRLGSDVPLYFLCLGLLLASLWVAANLLRSPTGRAMVAVRDSQIAAQSMGVEAARVKTKAFALSAFFTGIAGALMAHKLSFISPDQFTLAISIELLIMILIGGIGSLRGVVFGAIFLVAMPELLAELEQLLPGGNLPALRPLAFGLLLILVMLFEPRGINGLVEKAVDYVKLVPLYRKGMFARQRSFAKSERW